MRNSCIGSSINSNPFFVYIFLFHHMNLISSFTTCLTLFNGVGAMVWALWCVVTNMGFICFLWLICTLFFSYSYLYAISITTQNTIKICNNYRVLIYLSTVDIIFCMIFSFVLIRTIWGYFIYVKPYIFLSLGFFLFNVKFHKDI